MANKKFRQLRKKLQFSQLELSIVAQVSPAMVSAVEKYGYVPGAEVRGKIASAMGVREEQIWPNLAETPEVAVVD